MGFLMVQLSGTFIFFWGGGAADMGGIKKGI